MYILNLLVFLSCFIYVYVVFTQKIVRKVQLIVIFFVVYLFIAILALSTLKDMYYFYLLYKCFNISIYMVLIAMAYTPINFKLLTYYYFLSFISSLLFILGLYNLTQNSLSFYLINAAFLIKLRVYPFSDIISNVYKAFSYSAYLLLSYLINFSYLLMLFIFNQNNSLIINLLYVSIILIVVNAATLFYSTYNFNKQYELKGFVAYSSIVNLPIIITALCYSNAYANTDSSFTNYYLLLTYLGYYLFIYYINTFILNVYFFSLEPVKGKK